MAKGFNQIRSPKERPDEMVYQMLDRHCAADQRAFHGISANLEYGDYAPRAKGCYETPYDGGPQYGSGGGDQYRRPTSTTASIARIRQAFQCAQ